MATLLVDGGVVSEVPNSLPPLKVAILRDEQVVRIAEISDPRAEFCRVFNEDSPANERAEPIDPATPTTADETFEPEWNRYERDLVPESLQQFFCYGGISAEPIDRRKVLEKCREARRLSRLVRGGGVRVVYAPGMLDDDDDDGLNPRDVFHIQPFSDFVEHDCVDWLDDSKPELQNQLRSVLLDMALRLTIAADDLLPAAEQPLHQAFDVWLMEGSMPTEKVYSAKSRHEAAAWVKRWIVEPLGVGVAVVPVEGVS